MSFFLLKEAAVSLIICGHQCASDADLHLTLVWPVATVHVLSDSNNAGDSWQTAGLVNSDRDSYCIGVVLLY